MDPTILDPDGFGVVDSEGFTLDFGCATPCCGGSSTCCPSPCGKRWMLCLNSYSYQVERTITRARVRRIDELGNITEMEPGDGLRLLETVDLEGGPFALRGVEGPDGCTIGVDKPVPVRWVRLRDSTPDQVGDFRTEEVVCFAARAFCEAGMPFIGNGRPVDVSASLNAFLQGLKIDPAFGLVADITDDYADTGGSPVVIGSQAASVCKVPGGAGGIALGAFVVTRAVSRGFFWGPGSCSYDAVVTVREPFKTCTCGVNGGGEPYQCEAREGEILTTWRKSFRVTWKILEDCEEPPNIFPPCGGVEPTTCTGPVSYIEGAACGRNVGAPSRVYLPAGNVSACGVEGIGAAGGHCYKFSTSGPFRNAIPGGGILGTELVTKESPRTCCKCGALTGRCAGARLRRGGCRQNARRDTVTDALIVEESFIEDDGGCCCKGGDLITIQFMESEVELGANPQYGYRRRWQLTRGAGFAFRRDDPLPLGDPMTNPGAELRSLITDLDTLQEFPYSWGPTSALNTPAMVCEWTRLEVGYIDFDQPQNPNAGFWNSALQILLPCPGDGDVRLNGWRIERWAWNNTCGFASFDATWSHELGGTLRNQFRVTIERPEETGDPCSGGCTPPSPSPAGLGVVSAGGVVELGVGVGCSGCGGDGGIRL